MGFGLLLIGYIFAFTATVGLGNYLFAGMLLGGFVMYLGLNELKKYSPVFIYALVLDILYILCSFYETSAWVFNILGVNMPIFTQQISYAFDWIELFVGMLFNIAMLYGIADLSKRVDYEETRIKAYRNIIFVAIFYIFQLLMLSPIKIFDSDKGFFMTLLVILQIVYSVFNAYLIFKCYAMICPQGQEDMPRKPSKIGFINKFYEKLDEREQNSYEKAKDYLKNNQNNGQKNKKDKKKRK